MNAATVQRLKELLPTTLGSAEIRDQIAADILRRSVFSAKMASVPYLTRLRELLTGIAEGTINQGAARGVLMDMLVRMGYDPVNGEPSGLANPASIRRLNLIIETNRQMAASVATLANETESTVEQWPAWELARVEARQQPRPDWDARWRHAGEACGFEGALQNRFIALKSSPIWQALGDGAGGYRDTLGNPYPPFAYSSGMDWIDVSREKCEKLGLVAAGDTVHSPHPASLSPAEAQIAEAAKRSGFSLEQLAKGVF